MFDLEEIFFNNSLTVAQKQLEFLKLRTFYKQLLDELTDFYIACFRDLKVEMIKTIKKLKFYSTFEK